MIVQKTPKTKKEPYRCEHCDFSHSFYSIFENHKARHETKGKFQCPICTYSSERKHFVLKHLKSDHKTQQRPAQPQLPAGETPHSEEEEEEEDLPGDTSDGEALGEAEDNGSGEDEEDQDENDTFEGLKEEEELDENDTSLELEEEDDGDEEMPEASTSNHQPVDVTKRKLSHSTIPDSKRSRRSSSSPESSARKPAESPTIPKGPSAQPNEPVSIKEDPLASPRVKSPDLEGLDNAAEEDEQEQGNMEVVLRMLDVNSPEPTDGKFNFCHFLWR